MALQLFKIAEVTVASPQANIEFTSIPSGYTDLLLKLSGRTDRVASNAEFFFRFNGSTADFTAKKLFGSGGGGAVGSNSGTGGIATAANNTASTFGNTEIYIPNYTSSNFKSFSVDSVQESNDGAGVNIYAYLLGMLWSNTAAITSIAVYPEDSKNWVTQSTATLYGIL